VSRLQQLITPRLRGVVLRSGNSRVEIGDVQIEVELEPRLTVRLEADAFSQVTRSLNQRLVQLVMESAAIEKGLKVLDLFCGGGNFGLPAARRGAEVLGVDSDPLAIAAAVRNSREMR